MCVVGMEHVTKRLSQVWRGTGWHIYMTAERAFMLVKKVTYFGEFGYLDSSCIRKKHYFNVLEFLER